MPEGVAQVCYKHVATNYRVVNAYKRESMRRLSQTIPEIWDRLPSPRSICLAREERKWLLSTRTNRKPGALFLDDMMGQDASSYIRDV